MTENKGDLISRETLSKSMRKSINERYISWTKTITVADIATLIFDEIDNAPTVPIPDFKEGYKQAIIDGKTNFKRPQGEYIDATQGHYCSECYEIDYAYYDHKFCPYCGAAMQKEKNDSL